MCRARSQTLFARLRTLKQHGLPTIALFFLCFRFAFFKTNVVAKLSYASPAWWGFTSADDRNKRDEEGFTALHLAAKEDKPAALEVLLRIPGNMFVRDSQGRSILHTAVQFNRFHAMRVTIEVSSELDQLSEILEYMRQNNVNATEVEWRHWILSQLIQTGTRQSI